MASCSSLHNSTCYCSMVRGPPTNPTWILIWSSCLRHPRCFHILHTFQQRLSSLFLKTFFLAWLEWLNTTSEISILPHWHPIKLPKKIVFCPHKVKGFVMVCFFQNMLLHCWVLSFIVGCLSSSPLTRKKHLQENNNH